MTSLDKIIGLTDYKTFAGPDWPSYDQVIGGTTVARADIQQEVDEFVAMMRQTYQELQVSGAELAEQNQKRQQQIFYDKGMTTGTHCQKPWQTLGVNSNGDVFICSSPSWIPLFTGNILQADHIDQVLNSPVALKIRQEILAGRYYYCNSKICAFFSRRDPALYRSQARPGDQPMSLVPGNVLQVNQVPANLVFDFDYTCNFRCPSCRTSLINNNKHHVIRAINQEIVQKIKDLIIDNIESQPVQIRWCGGEPFISEAYLELLEYIVETNKPNIRHIIQTNGSYLKKKSDLVKQLLPVMDELSVSFDAATADTYHKIRLNGQWDSLLDNVKWVRNIIDTQKTKTKLSADFVVQLDNYKEIPAFVKLCDQIGIDQIHFQKMWNWGTWPQTEFDAKNIYNSSHPDYHKLVEVFKQASVPIRF
jgi:sulfatase maturation enzyme AslB (radical SAM superfamily)